ncbi:MAG: TlpA family protein disulfide reductase [Ilumatobacter sp.]|uniref:TlpA family protein disulfide reductase n=1 Tax=Ilumatobacter sp. TaxID=1967498 RepID=UPI00391985AC
MCNREAPSVEEAANNFADQVNFVGVTWTGSDSSYQDFIDRHGLTFPQIQDDAAAVFSRFDIAYQPAIVIVKADGSTETVAGAVDETLLEQIISEAA